MSLLSITVNHFSRNRSMDDDLEGRAREREAPSAERGFPKTLFFFQAEFWLRFRELIFQSIEFQTQAFLAAVVVELALRGRPVREAGESLCLCLLSVSSLGWQSFSLIC